MQDEEEGFQEKSNNYDDTNATDLSLYDEEVERQIDDDYRISNTLSQKTRRTNDYLYDPTNMNSSHLISARIANNSESLLFSESEDITNLSQQMGDRQPQVKTQQINTQRSYPTLLTFISGTLVGGNYDDIIDQVEESGNREGDIFEGTGINQEQRVPTLIGVARKVSIEEGKQLDKKQYIAYEIIASSFLLSLIEDGVGIEETHSECKDELIKRLKARGGHPQLIMFLTGFSGAGKSTCVAIAQRFCYEFCRAVDVAWDNSMFLFTATTGSAAGLLAGRTIHDAIQKGENSWNEEGLQICIH